MIQSPGPLLTNDLAGFIKIIAIIVGIVLLPVGALVVYFLKSGAQQKIDALTSELNGFGDRVNAREVAHAHLDERVTGIYSSIAGSQRDILDAIRASGDAQMRAVHLVEIQVARLQERNDLGEAVAAFGKSIERLANTFDQRPEHRQ